MTESSTPESVGQWVAQHPATSRVFQEFKIDFCCGGGVTLEEACRKRDIDPQEVLQRLNEARDGREQADEVDWLSESLTRLADHIEQTHHQFLRSELPRLEKMARRVAQVHGEKDADLIKVRDVFLELRGELEPHMMKEENILFPAIRQLELSATRPEFPFGTVANPVRMMEHEHDSAGTAMSRLRELTHEFEPPPEACNTWRALFDGLGELETDLHIHIHKENNILFPRALKLEKELQVGTNPLPQLGS